MITFKLSKAESPIAGVPARMLSPAPHPVLAPYVGLPRDLSQELRQATLPPAPSTDLCAVTHQLTEILPLQDKLSSCLKAQARNLFRLGAILYFGGAAVAIGYLIVSPTIAATSLGVGVVGAHLFVHAAMRKLSYCFKTSNGLLKHMIRLEGEIAQRFTFP